MEHMEKRVRLGVLLDAYGPLLTEHKREILSAYSDEDLSLQEIAEQLGITRQGVYDAVEKGERQLMAYENSLHVISRAMEDDKAILQAIECIDAALSGASAEAKTSLQNARTALYGILRYER